MDLYAKFTCYLCSKRKLGKEVGSVLGSGKFLSYICNDCTKTNYCWATREELITEYERQQKRLIKSLNRMLEQIGGE